MTELFNKKFVYFLWEDELVGKKGFFADNIENLRINVNDNRYKNNVSKSDDKNGPFHENERNWRFFYYDPHYEIKRAYIEGKTIQVTHKNLSQWYDIGYDGIAEIKVKGLSWFDDDYEYRIKLDERKTLKWTDLRIGDVIRCKSTKVKHLVTGIHYDNKLVYFGGEWTSDIGLKDWEKVEE